MAEEVTQAQEPTEVEGTEPHGDAVDWEAKYKEAKAQSRKWEERSKANKEKADKWDAYEQEGMSEAERVAKRAEEAEAELARLKADAQRRADAAEVSKASHVPESLLLYCTDRDAMEAFAREYAEAVQDVPAAPPAPSSRVIRGGEAQVSTADQFAEMAERFFNH